MDHTAFLVEPQDEESWGTSPYVEASSLLTSIKVSLTAFEKGPSHFVRQRPLSLRSRQVSLTVEMPR